MAQPNEHPTIPVLILITDLIMGGAQQALVRLLSGLDKSTYRVHVVALYNGEGKLAEEIRQLGIPVTDLDIVPKWRVDRLLRLFKIITTERPVILHSWMIHANIIGRILGKLLSIPVILISRRTNNLGSENRVKLNRYLATWSDAVITVSESTRQQELRETELDENRVITIQNGLDINQFPAYSRENRIKARETLQISANAWLVGSVGRLVDAKGYPDLLEAIAILKHSMPQIMLLIVGDGERRPQLLDHVVQLGIQDHVIFAGKRHDVPDILPAFDCFVLSSHWEGMPNALLEAMAVGLPVIGTKIPAIQAIITDQTNGRLVRAGEPQEIADTLKQIALSSDVAYRLGQNARQHIIDNYSIDYTVQATESLYQRLLASK